MPPSDVDDARVRAERCAADVRAAIAGDAIGFDRFVEIALYGDHGFYQQPDGSRGAGRRGDFITSAEVGPLFGAVIARFITTEWERLGAPGTMTVIDAGAGPGTLARSVLRYLPDPVAERVRYVAVEVSSSQRQRHPDGIVSVASLEEVPDRLGGPVGPGVVVANELLDNLPFRLAVHDGAWREAFVVDSGDGTFAEVLSAPFDPVPAVLPERPAHGARAPLLDAARTWVDTARQMLGCGTVLVADYAVATTAELAGRPLREWLRTYRGHERGAHPLREPGTQDITCEVALDQLAAPYAVCAQREWLQRWGIDELVEEGRAYWDQHRSHPDLDAMRMRSRISEAEALIDPGGLGGFSILEWRVG